jgi:hypothetical protein
MIALNLIRVSKSLAYGRNGEEIRPLLKRIESSYRKGDKVCVYINRRSIPSFIYEWQYSYFSWMKALQRKDIYIEKLFRAGQGSGYDYEWYLFTRDNGLANSVSNALEKDGIILEDYIFLPEVRGYKAKARK